MKAHSQVRNADEFGERADMRNRMRPSVFVVCAGLLSLTRSALADLPVISKDQCIETNARAQSQRRANKLSEARELLRACGDLRCPAAVRDDCAQRLDELEGVQPTIVFDAKDSAGNDLNDVVVTLDGLRLVDRLDGSALNIDPGFHEFVFQVAGAPPVKRGFVLKIGEKARRERVLLSDDTTVPKRPLAPGELVRASPPRPDAEPRLQAEGGAKPLRVGGLVVTGVGAAGIVAGSVFALLARSASAAQKRACASTLSCPSLVAAQQDHDTAVWQADAATAAFVGGGVLVAGGLLLYVLAPSASGKHAGGGVSVAPNLGPYGGGVSISGGFD